MAPVSPQRSAHHNLQFMLLIEQSQSYSTMSDSASFGQNNNDSDELYWELNLVIKHLHNELEKVANEE